MRIDLKKALKEMTGEEVFEVAQTSKKELEERLASYSVYEPTGDPTRDQEHFILKCGLRDMLADLKK